MLEGYPKQKHYVPTIHYVVKAIISECGSKRPCDLAAHDVPRIAGGFRHLADSTRYERHSELRHVLRLLAEEYGAKGGLHRHVPRVQPPAPRNVTVTQGQRDMIMNAAGVGMRCWLLFCSDLAIRSGTAVKLSPSNYNAEAQTISFRTKCGAGQTLPVTEELRELLECATECEPLTPYVQFFRKRHGAGVVTLRTAFKKMLKDLGLKKHIVPHDLRRTTAVRTLEVTQDLRLVQALLGHKKMNSTFHYLDHRNTQVSLATLEAAKLKMRKEAIQ
jgi:integrase